ncbi:hypothetical protein CL645_01335 [bacterium]|nr:hypothetical protein [bacterium]|tara:strand:- start:2992 stop:3624 length:633 start_codon:yes stop_codon:yes gene_type:complete
MIVQAQPRELIITCLNSYANFNLAYWNYADPGKIIRFWVGYRERAEFLISEMEESDEKEEMIARLFEADRVVLKKRLNNLRSKDFVNLPRFDVPFERWWWYIDLIKTKFIKPEPGFAGSMPQSVSKLFGFGVEEVVEEEVEIDLSNLKIGKVWIAPGCIVCNACEEICPDVFDVQEETCVIRDDPNLELVQDIVDAADACPVEVIKFQPA